MIGSNEIDYYMPLGVSLMDIEELHKKGWHLEPDEKIPSHESVIKPLLKNCMYAYVYGIKENDGLYYKNKNILIKEKGKFRFDTTKECVIEHECLWNSVSHKRGSIIIVLGNNLDIFSEILKHTGRPAFCETPNSGNTISALTRCKDEMKKGNIGIVFPASNGIERIEIYANKENMDKILKIAEANCQEPYFWGDNWD